jgi:Contractile injection system tube protein
LQLAPKGKITKASLGGKKFLYNPNQIDDSNPVTYNGVKTAGMSYPVPVYGGGEQRTITFEIYLNDRVQAGITKSYIKHLEGFLPPKKKTGYQFKAPKKCKFAFGWLVEDCYLIDLQKSITAWTPTLQPIEATLTVTLAVIQ